LGFFFFPSEPHGGGGGAEGGKKGKKKKRPEKGRSPFDSPLIHVPHARPERREEKDPQQGGNGGERTSSLNSRSVGRPGVEPKGGKKKKKGVKRKKPEWEGKRGEKEGKEDPHLSRFFFFRYSPATGPEEPGRGGRGRKERGTRGGYFSPLVLAPGGSVQGRKRGKRRRGGEEKKGEKGKTLVE